MFPLSFVPTVVVVLISIQLEQTFGQSADVWLTTGDEANKLRQLSPITGSSNSIGGLTVSVDLSPQQTIDGFGAAITNSAAYLLYTQVSDRAAVLRDLFDPTTGIGISYVRLVMGGSDFNAVQPYTYDDIASGTDFTLSQFSINKDRDFVIPLLKEILLVNPSIKILASPWSAPAWMKTSNSLNGGSLLSGSQYLDTLANYFIRFIQDYRAEGISIDAITVQNEPEHSSNGYPTMSMAWDQQLDLIKNYLGPRMQAAGLSTKIVLFDHNWDLAWYPLNILADPAVHQYVAGSAWHCYGGNRYDPLQVKQQYPQEDLYFTECTGGQWDTSFPSSFGWNLQNLFIGQTRIGSRTVLLWNMALDESYGPRVGVSGGCADCRGVLTVHPDRTTSRNVEYYTIGHFSKFVTPGARYIPSTTYESNELETTAFQNPDGSIVVVVVNLSWSTAKEFQVYVNGQYYHYANLPLRSAVTFVI